MRTLRSAEIVSGIFFSILGLVILAGAMKISANTGGMGNYLGPRTLPLSMGIILLVTGGGLALKTWFFKGQDPGVAWPDRTGARQVLVALAMLAVYVALMYPLGFPLSSLLFISAFTWYFGRYHVLYALSIGTVSAAVVYFLFIRFLELSFPVGLFFA